MNPRRESQVAAGCAAGAAGCAADAQTRPARLGAHGRALRGQSGQILPLVVVVMLAILATGMIVFWLGYSSSLSANAQTAADAAALAGENEVAAELRALQPVNQAEVCAKADGYAGRNQGHDASCELIPNSSSSLGYDVQVVAQTNGSLPNGSPDAGKAANGSARASADPFAQASPAVRTTTATTPCAASLLSGPTFVPHGGQDGFSPDPGTNYSYGCESKLAGALDQLAVTLHLHLTGTSGYVSSSPPTTTDPAAPAHACGAASTTQGLSLPGSTSPLPDSTLSQYGLTRPFPGKPDELELSGTGCGERSTSVDASASPPVGLGNLNIHLVALGGGPAGSLLSLVGGGSSSIGESALQVGCQIYKVWQATNTPQELLLISLMVASAESAFGQNTGGNQTDPNQSVGVFQQISADGWGTIPEELNVVTSAEMFFFGGHENGQATTEGLLYHYGQNPGLPAYELAQLTQGSGAGASSNGLANYGAPGNVAAAQAMLSQVTSGACKNVAS